MNKFSFCLFLQVLLTLGTIGCADLSIRKPDQESPEPPQTALSQEPPVSAPSLEAKREALEKPILAAARGRVQRRGSELRFLKGNKIILSLKDEMHPEDVSMNVFNQLFEYLPKQDVFVVENLLYEGLCFTLIKAGKIVTDKGSRSFCGQPSWSPSKEYFVVAPFDTAFEWAPDPIQLWQCGRRSCSKQVDNIPMKLGSGPYSEFTVHWNSNKSV